VVTGDLFGRGEPRHRVQHFLKMGCPAGRAHDTPFRVPVERARVGRQVCVKRREAPRSRVMASSGGNAVMSEGPKKSRIARGRKPGSAWNDSPSAAAARAIEAVTRAMRRIIP
jgi:hypothetical protein